MKLALVSAVSENRAIGFNNDLCYKIKKDLRYFKNLTIGRTVIMGENTFKSLPNGPLPGRRNIVLSPKHFENVDTYDNLQDALKSCKNEDLVFIIGGGMLYKTSIDLADGLYLTEIHATPENADTFFPEYKDKFTLIRKIEEEENGLRFDFSKYIKNV
jgi:dihydrofolate reductase